MFKIRAKSTLMALVLAIAAMLFAMGGARNRMGAG